MGLAKYWINIDEFLDAFKDSLEPLLLSELKKKLTMFDNCEDLLRDIEKLLPDNKFSYLAKKIEDLVSNGYSGESHVDGIRSDIPPLRGDFDTIWKSPAFIALTGIQLETTGWKPQDTYSLSVAHYIRDKDGYVTQKTLKTLFKQVPFKEIAEHKSFHVPYNYFAKGINKVKSQDEVIFTVHNNSGNSRQLYIDIEYLWLGKGMVSMGPTAIFLDVSGSMFGILANMSALMKKFLFNLRSSDRVTICFVADRFAGYTRGSYDFKRHDFKNKDEAINFISDMNNIPNFPGGQYDVVTIQSPIDYNMTSFDNYVFCTDQSLEDYPEPDNLKNKIKSFFKNKDVYTIPTCQSDKDYWNKVYNEIGLFKPINL